MHQQQMIIRHARFSCSDMHVRHSLYPKARYRLGLTVFFVAIYTSPIGDLSTVSVFFTGAI